jgi:hypothetical protein
VEHEADVRPGGRNLRPIRTTGAPVTAAAGPRGVSGGSIAYPATEFAGPKPAQARDARCWHDDRQSLTSSHSDRLLGEIDIDPDWEAMQ